MQPRQTLADQPVIIYANITNSGDEPSNYTATLKVNGQIEETRSGIVSSHTAVPLKFEVLRNTPGTYKIDINGQQDYFVITSNSENENKSMPSRFWAFLSVIVLAVISAAILIWRLRYLL